MNQPCKFVSANGLRFAYLESGTGPLVLLAHGFPDTAHSWDAVRFALAAAGYRAVAPFLRGYAPTEIPPDGAYDADTLGRDLLALIDALGEREAIVVGHDWGAAAAYSAAALSPERMRLLVTIELPHPAAVIPTPRLFWTLRHFLSLTLPGAAGRVRRGGFAYLDELVRRWSPTWDAPADATAAVKEAFAAPGRVEAALGYYRALRPRPPRGQRLRIRVPTICFRGDDGVLDVRPYERARARFTGPYEVVRMPGGHFLHREHPELFRDALLATLSRRLPAS